MTNLINFIYGHRNQFYSDQELEWGRYNAYIPGIVIGSFNYAE